VEINNQIQLKFHGVDFPSINLSSEKLFTYNVENAINIDVIPKVFYPKDQRGIFKIVQEVHLSSENHFSLFILAIGTFELGSDVHDELRKTFVNVKAPAIMFPYVRAFISTLTANLGNVTGALIIPTQFFKGELEAVQDYN
jgi:preprotein translocase subunit SecB